VQHLTIDGKFGLSATASSSGAYVHEFAHHGHGDTITVSDPYLLFSGDYKRSGTDLILSKDGREHVVHDYFTGHKHAALVAPDGARLSGDIVDALTGHVQYAQAGGAPDAGQVIGHVTKLAGNATVIRNGVSIVLNMGDNVHKGDVVQSGSNSQLGITFIDGTVFGLASNARMVLNDMVYDPNGSSNSSFLSLVQGTITFLAGETAKHGDMKIGTPVATMGIRGTAVLVEIGFDVQVTDPNSTTPLSIPVKFQVLREKDGTVGSYFLYANDDLTYSNPIATINQAGQVTSYSANGQITVAQLAQLAPEVKQVTDFVLGLGSQSNPNPQSNGPGGSGVTPDPGTPKDTTPLKDVPVGVPTPLLIPINVPDASNPGVTIEQLFKVNVTVLKTVDVAPVVDKASFDIAAQVTITDSNPADVLTPYVPGSAQVQSVTAPAYAPAGIDLKNFVAVDPSTGHISYDPTGFAFLKAGDKAVIIIGFDASAGIETFHESVTITINGVNDAPVIDHAAIAVSEGGTVVLTEANIGVIDPDSTSFKFTVSNVAHGTFQTTADGVTWVDAATFTTADLAAGHVRFVHDGGVLAPAFSIQADDGEAASNLSNVLAGVVDFVSVGDPLTIVAISGTITELAGTGNSAPDFATGSISFADIDPAARPTVSTAFVSAVYKDAHGHDITSSLTPAQVAALEIPLSLAQSSTNTNNGSIGWSYQVADKSLDFLAKGETLTLNYTAEATDHLGGTASTPLSVTITGANDAPVITTAATQTIAENQTFVAALTATDADTADQDTFSIAGGANAAVFDIAGGNLVFKSAPDFETGPHAYEVVISVFDGTQTTTETITVNITDVAPTVPIDVNAAANTIAEGAANGSAVGITASSVDPNGPAATYSLIDSAGGRFAVDANTGVVTVANGAAIDFETAVGHAYGITVQATAGALSTTQNFSIAVTNVNEAPAGTDKAVSIAEDTTYTFVTADFGFSDPGDSSAPNSLLAVKMTTVPGAGAGTLTNNGVTVNAGDTVLASDIAAHHLVFTPALNANGSPEAAFTFQVQDDGGTANGGVDLEQSPNTFTINVTAVNDAPVNSVPGAQSVNEDATLTFSSGNGNAISVSDVDERPGFPESVTLQVQHGTLTLGSTAGLQSFIDNSSLVVLSGSLASLNNALQGLTYKPTADYNGPDSLSVMTGDNGNTGSGIFGPFAPLFDQDRVAITVNPVNDAPVNHVPAVQAVNEDTNLVFTGANAITISDVDGGSGDETVTLTVANGTLTLGSTLNLTSFTNNAASVTLTGTVAHVNTALDGLIYHGNLNFNGADSLGIVTHDNGNTGGGDLTDTGSVTINVAAVNDAPVIDGGDSRSLSVAENTTAVETVVAHDPDGPSLTYSIVTGSGSPDSSKFAIDPAGVLSFKQAPDFEHPTDFNHDNIYTVQVMAFDGTLSDIQTLHVQVTDVNEAPHAANDVVITNNVNGSTYEIPDWALLANDTDPDGNTLSLTKITASSEFASIDLDTNPGNVTIHDIFVGGSFTYRASDGSLSDTADVAVTQDTGTMNGGSGSEIFIGDSNGTTINANGGNDILIGNGGNDTLNGGSGNDTYVFGLHDGHDVINDSSGLDTIRIEANGAALTGLSFAENSTHDLVVQFDGQQVTVDDHFIGNDNVGGLQFDGSASYDGYSLGSDLYFLSNDGGLNRSGTSGNDILSGDSAANTISGGDGNDLLFGNAGSDTLSGGSGNDLLVGGAGNDFMTGGPGNDTFVFAQGSGHDTVADFTPGQDHISLDYAAFNASQPNGFANWLASHAAPANGDHDVLIDLNVDGHHPGVDTILLKNVTIASLHAGDFIVHPLT
jgi:VCBS repeat-containing protein